MSPLSLSALALGSRTAQHTGERAKSEKSKYEGTDGPTPVRSRAESAVGQPVPVPVRTGIP